MNVSREEKSNQHVSDYAVLRTVQKDMGAAKSPAAAQILLRS
jgi:hypothetical protein